MSTADKLDTAQLRKLLADGTLGPWIFNGCYLLSNPERSFIGSIGTEDDAKARADAALIVAAVNALGPLLDEIEKLRQLTGDYHETSLYAVARKRNAQLEQALEIAEKKIEDTWDAAARIAELDAALQEIETIESMALSEFGKIRKAVGIARAAREHKALKERAK